LYKDNRLVGNETTSGRFNIWKDALFIINEKKIVLGYGPQADRFLFLNFQKSNSSQNIYYDKHGNPFLYDNNSSNALIYAYLCGGVIGVLLLVLIYLLIIVVVTNNIFKEKKFYFKYDLWLNFSKILLIYLVIRSIFENSFSVFGIDYVFLILAYFENRNFSKSTS
jgi:O-antigen ligase